MSLSAKNHDLGRDCYYETTVSRPQWPKLERDATADVVVIGGGLAGLSCALELAEQGRSVVLLEAETICGQASGRNGGQAIAGFACGQSWLEQELGLPDAQKLWQLSLDSIARMKHRMSTHGIDCDAVWSYMTVADRARTARSLRDEAQQMRQNYGLAMTYLEGQDLKRHIDSDRYVAGLIDPASGHLNPLRYGLGIAQAAQAAGVSLHENSCVETMERAGNGWLVRTSDAYVRAHNVILAANCGLLWQAQSLARSLHARIMPVGTYVIATERLPQGLANSLLPHRAAVCDNNFVLDYFRLSGDHRMLFGGRVSYTTATPARLTDSMRERMIKVFPQLAQARVEHTWGGYVDISRERAPDWGQLDDGVYYLQGFSGHGLAATTLAGLVVSRAILGQPQDLEIFKRIKQSTFPGGAALRVPLLVLATSYFRLRDLLN